MDNYGGTHAEELSSWACKACTWVNEDSTRVSCMMCNTKRAVRERSPVSSSKCAGSGAATTRRNFVAKASAQNVVTGSTAVQTPKQSQKLKSAEKKEVTASHDGPRLSQQRPGTTSGLFNFFGKSDSTSNSRVADPSFPQGALSPALDNQFESSQHGENLLDNNDINTKPQAEPSRQAESMQQEADESETAESPPRKWDAFAALESNLQSSDEDESSEDDDEEFDDENRENDADVDYMKEEGDESYAISGKSKQVVSLESCSSESQSSDEEYCDSSDGSEFEAPRTGKRVGSEFNAVSSRKRKSTCNPGNEQNHHTECVDLVDTDDEVENENAKQNFRDRSIKPSPKGTIRLDCESDSSLSEVECRQLPTPSSQRLSRSTPPWQRSTPARKGRIVQPAQSFLCMNRRNDLIGGSGAGVNAFTFSNRNGNPDDSDGDENKKRKKRGAANSSKRKSTAKTKKTKTTTSTSRSKTRKSNASTSADSAKAPTKKRKRTRKQSGSYGRRGTRGRSNYRARSNTTTNYRGNARSAAERRNGNAWALREQGIRPMNGYRGDHAPYMNIGKQEPMLSGIGGASIKF